MLNVIDEYNTIATVISRQASLGRFGDGELRVCVGGKIKSQPYNNKLRERLLEILTCNHFDFLIGVPRVFGREDDYPAKQHWNRFFNKTDIVDLLDPEKEYFSSFVSRIESAPEIASPSYWNLVECLWMGRDVVVVQGDHYQFTDACDLTGELDQCCSVNQVLAPCRDAFRYYDTILNEICQYPKDHLVVMSLGATATVLAYDLYSKGYQALDVGRLAIHHVRAMGSWENN